MSFQWIVDTPVNDFLVKGAVVIGFVVAVVVGINVTLKTLGRLKSGFKIKGKNGEIDFTPELQQEAANRNITQSLEVRDYLHNLNQIIFEVKDDIRSRVSENGWDKKSKEELSAYFDRAVKDHDVRFTSYMNNFYYYNSLVSRIELHDWNETIRRDIELDYRNMYKILEDIVKESYISIAEKEKNLENQKNNRQDCRPETKNCPNASAIIDQVIDLYLDKTVRIKRKCMVEVERCLEEIKQRFYSHYLVIYKKALDKARGENV